MATSLAALVSTENTFNPEQFKRKLVDLKTAPTPTTTDSAQQDPNPISLEKKLADLKTTQSGLAKAAMLFRPLEEVSTHFKEFNTQIERALIKDKAERDEHDMELIRHLNEMHSLFHDDMPAEERKTKLAEYKKETESEPNNNTKSNKNIGALVVSILSSLASLGGLIASMVMNPASIATSLGKIFDVFANMVQNGINWSKGDSSPSNTNSPTSDVPNHESNNNDNNNHPNDDQTGEVHHNSITLQ